MGNVCLVAPNKVQDVGLCLSKVPVTSWSEAGHKFPWNVHHGGRGGDELWSITSMKAVASGYVGLVRQVPMSFPFSCPTQPM